MTQSSQTPRLDKPLRRLLQRARFVLLLEALWPVIWPALTVLGLFGAVALMDVLPNLNGWLHLAFLILFALLFLWAGYHGWRAWQRPAGHAAERRVEEISGLVHRPLTALQDRLAANHTPTAAALWTSYQKRILASLGSLRTGWPRPGPVERDPYATRAAVYLLLIIGISVGGSDLMQRVQRALTPNFANAAPLPVELEAWLNPPSYTQKPPVRLSLTEDTKTIAVPAGSALLARLFGGTGEPRLAIGEKSYPFAARDKHNFILEQQLEHSGTLTLHQGSNQLATWRVTLEPDSAPEILWTDPLSHTERGALDIAYTATDDHGLKAVWMEVRRNSAPAMDASRQGDRPDPDQTDVIVVDLPLPSLDPKQVSEATYFDLTPHPWAGLEIVAVLVAEDAIGQTGRSEPVVFTLPERYFHHATAKALIEQRKRLNDAALTEARQHAALALSAIRRLPEAYDNDAVVRLSLTAAIERLRSRTGDAEVAGVQALLWDTALRLEDGNLSLAERRLRDAQRALQEALANGAEDEEIARLSEELKKALDEYLQSLAENMQRMAEQGQQQRPFDPNAQMVDRNQLQEMIDRAQELSELGAKDQARELLQELQRMLENLQQNPMAAMPQQMQQQQQTLQELNEMMQEQQSQMDRAFRMSPNADPNQMRRGQRGQPNQQGQQGQQRGQQRQPGEGEGPMAGMAQDQESLRQRLENFLRQLEQTPGGVPQPLRGAEQSMGQARDSLQDNQPGAATRSQAEALEQMAEGMRNLAEQMAEQFGQNQPGQAQRDDPTQDPMGRPMNSGNTDTSRVDIPEKSDLQRAREILEELRRRSGELTRPLLERRYIDRLMRRFD